MRRQSIHHIERKRENSQIVMITWEGRWEMGDGRWEMGDEITSRKNKRKGDHFTDNEMNQARSSSSAKPRPPGESLSVMHHASRNQNKRAMIRCGPDNEKRRDLSLLTTRQSAKSL